MKNFILLVICVLSLSWYERHYPLIKLSNEMIAETQRVHHCTRRGAIQLSIERDVFLTGHSPRQESDCILVFEHYQSCPNVVYSIMEPINNSPDAQVLCYQGESDMTLPGKLRIRREMLFDIYRSNFHPWIYSWDRGKLEELAKCFFEKEMTNEELKNWFGKSSYTDENSAYYLWIIKREGTRYKTDRYLYLGQVLL